MIKTFLILALDKCEWSAAGPGRLAYLEITLYQEAGLVPVSVWALWSEEKSCYASNRTAVV
jgi:hypothetical protein